MRKYKIIKIIAELLGLVIGIMIGSWFVFQIVKLG